MCNCECHAYDSDSKCCDNCYNEIMTKDEQELEQP